MELTDTPIKELKNTLFLLDGLHSNLSHERELLTTLTSQMGTSFKQLENQLKALENQTNENRKQIQEIFHEEAKHAVEQIAKTGCTELKAKVDEILSNLEQTTSQAANQLYKTQEATGLFSKRLVPTIALATVIGGLVGGILSGSLVYYLTPQLDPKIQAQLNAGEILLRVWPKLSNQEKERLMAK
jgi:predicted nuclease with TOPRIM domain